MFARRPGSHLLVFNPHLRLSTPSVAVVAGAGSGVGSGAGSVGGGGSGGSGDSSRHNFNSRPASGDSRKRNSFVAGLDNSPGSVDSAELDGTENGQQQHDEERRHPVKRACNECRQQKVSPNPINFLSQPF